MGENFNICFSTTLKHADQRGELIEALASLSSAVMSRPIWLTRVRGDEMSGSAWTGEPIEVSPDEVVCIYPRERSASSGAWLIEATGETEVWTLSLPIKVARSHLNETMELLWRVGAAYSPCVAGPE